MVTSPAGNTHVYSGPSKRPTFQPSLHRMSRRKRDTGAIPCFGVRKPVAHPSSMPTHALPEIDMSDDYSHEHGKVHGS
jgi:hypothetical protein